MDLEEFSSGKPALDDWLKEHSSQARGSGTANTFVLQNSNGEVSGYYSLSMGSIFHNEATERIRKGTGRHQIPVLLLARLAVDLKFQGQGIGRALLRDAVIRGVDISMNVAFRAIITRPIDENAANFYRKYKFEPSPILPDHLIILVKDARKELGIPNIASQSRVVEK
jgi:GNAT superfamily N-acetyltransferase